MKTIKRVAHAIAIAILLILATGGVMRLVGGARYLVTDGVSMTPIYHSGDLVVVTPASTYRVGEIAAYHSKLLNTTVLHRIVGVSDGTYTFKGDHNSWVDPEHPRGGQLLGHAWIDVPHGGILLSLRGLPVLLLALLCLVAHMVLSPKNPREKSSSSRRERPKRDQLHRRVTIGLVLGEFVLGSVLALSLLPSGQTNKGPRQLPTVQTSTFTYTAKVPPNPVYPTGEVETGDPVFVRVAPALTIEYLYQADGSIAAELQGKTQLSVSLRSSNGWHTDSSLGPPVPVTLGRALVTGRLDLASIEATLGQVRALTGVDTGTVSLVLDAKTEVTAPGGISDHIDVPLSMQLTPTQLSSSTNPSGQQAGRPGIVTRKFLSTPPTASRSHKHVTLIRLPQEARIAMGVGLIVVALGLVLHFYPSPTSPEPSGTAPRGGFR